MSITIAPPITRERFTRGWTIQGFTNAMTRNRERFEENITNAAVSESDAAYFRSLKRPVHVLVLAEDWCGDVIAGLPVLARLVQEAGAPDVRILFRDQNLDIMDLFLKQGKYRSIPVFVVLDERFNVIGHVIERSPRATAALEKAATEALLSNPEFAPPGTGPFEFDKMTTAGREAVSQAMKGARAAHGVEWNQDLIDDLRALVARTQ